MSFSEIYNNHFSVVQNLDFCLRLVLAFVVGGLIGFERSHRFKEAGIRTHILVCCTTTLLMLVSKYGFADLTWGGGEAFFGTRGADSSRIAAQAVSGISFLCAGVIFKVGGTIKGLTTAAGIWLTAGIGLAIGAGMYIPVACTLILLWVLQFIMYRFPYGSDAHGGNHLTFLAKSDSGFDQILQKQLKEWRAMVTQSKITHNADGTTEYDLVIRRKEDLEYKMIKKFVEEQGDIILSVSTSSLYMHIH
ncbi:MAG: MgtC/SapB family protein [Eubacteriales bacterium]|nr:MgtC/SapB family protein [Eubacteriales bacterium]